MSAISTATYGALSAITRFDRAAGQTVSDSSQSQDVVSDFVDQIDARTAFEANISVIKASDAMTGQLLNIKT